MTDPTQPPAADRPDGEASAGDPEGHQPHQHGADGDDDHDHAHPAHAVIVGVGPGLGASLARVFANHGHDLTLVARTAASTGPIASELTRTGRRVLELHVDISDLEALAATIAEASAWQPITRLHHNASRHAGSLLEADPTALRDAMAVNALAAVTALRAALPDLAHVGGVVTWTGAGAAINPTAQYGVLAQGKAALRAAAFALAPELAERGVRLRMLTVRGSISPGGPLDPDRIAEAFWQHAEDPHAEVELMFHGH